MYFTIMDDDRAFGETLKNKLESEYHAVVDVYHGMVDLDQIKLKWTDFVGQKIINLMIRLDS